MQAGVQLLRQKLVDATMARDAAHPGEGSRDDADAEMGFAGSVEGGVVAGLDMMMAGVKVALVDDLQPLGRQRFGQSRLDFVLYRQIRHPSPYEPLAGAAEGDSAVRAILREMSILVSRTEGSINAWTRHRVCRLDYRLGLPTGTTHWD